MTDTGCTKCGGSGSLLPLIGVLLTFILIIGSLYAFRRYLARLKEEEAEQEEALSKGIQEQEVHLELRANPLNSQSNELPQMQSVGSLELKSDPQDTHADTCGVEIELKDVKKLAGGSDYQQFGHSTEDKQKQIEAFKEKIDAFKDELISHHEDAGVAIDVKQLQEEVKISFQSRPI